MRGGQVPDGAADGGCDELLAMRGRDVSDGAGDAERGQLLALWGGQVPDRVGAGGRVQLQRATVKVVWSHWHLSPGITNSNKYDSEIIRVRLGVIR